MLLHTGVWRPRPCSAAAACMTAATRRYSIGGKWPRASPTSQPGYLMYDSVEDLHPAKGQLPLRPQESPLQLLRKTLFGGKGPTKLVPDELLPNLGLVRTLRDAGTLHCQHPPLLICAEEAIGFHQHQNSPSPSRIIRRVSTERHQQLLHLLLQTSRQRAGDRRLSIHTELVEPDDQEEDPMVMTVAEAEALVDIRPLDDHIQCANVLKKRRAKMRRHKHKKRLKANRYKAKK